MGNKAHTATARRIAKRYGATFQDNGGLDVETGSMTIAVETSATLSAGVALLQPLVGERYIAVTNKEALTEALRLTDGTPIGVMDSHGNIVKAAACNPRGDDTP